MIMGAGKTTVVGPLLALLLGDGEKLITQVVPAALLEFSRDVMRKSFAAVFVKPVYTFLFNRKTETTERLYLKLRRARVEHAVVCSTPASIKSFVLKWIEMMHDLDSARTLKLSDQKSKRKRWKVMTLFRERSWQQRVYSESDLVQLRTECGAAVQIHSELHAGVLILDEVDLLLHPLKSELNWPVGEKAPLDVTTGVVPGLRYGPRLQFGTPAAAVCTR